MPKTSSCSNDTPARSSVARTRSGFDFQTVSIIGVIAGVMIAVAPWAWDAFGPLRWLIISTFGFLAITAACSHAITIDRLVMVFGGLIAWLAIAAVMGVDKLHAWIGTPDRHFGVFTWVLCLGLLLAARTLQPRQRELAVSAFVVLGLVSGGYAVLEFVGWAPVDITFASDRLGGVFGQPALLGAAMVLVVPICAGVAADPAFAMAWRGVAVTAVALTTFALLGSQTRAAWVGAAIAGALVLWPRRQRLMRSQLALGAVAVVVFAGALLTPVGARALSLFDRGGVSAGRLDEWQVAGRALVARPLVGFGPEGYRIAFGGHVDTEYVVAHGRDVITDRAHTGVLDVAVTGGFTAGLLYVAMIGLVVSGAWHLIGGQGGGGEGIRGGGTTEDRSGAGAPRPIDVGLAAGVIGYLVQQQFLFPLAEVDPLFWIAVGLMLPVLPGSARPTDTTAGTTTRHVPAGVRGIFLGLAILALTVGILDVLADRQVVHALAAPTPEQATAHADRARALRGDSIRYDFIASRVWADHQLDVSIARLEDGLRISPADPALMGERARRLLDLAQATASVADLEIALDALGQVVRADPANPQHVLRLGVGHALRSEHPETAAQQRLLDRSSAEGAFRRVIKLAPENDVARRNLTLLLEKPEKDQ